MTTSETVQSIGLYIRDSFSAGWMFGRRTGRELTAREIAESFPDADPDAFTQGNIDGIRADRFRMDN